MLPWALLPELEKALATATGLTATISSSRSLPGGCINEAAKITYAGHDFFVKWNSKPAGSDVFAKEAAGLSLLRNRSPFHVPLVYGHHDDGPVSFLLLEYIEQASPDTYSWQQAGAHLAQMHRQQAPAFGLEWSNYIGQLPQQNSINPQWDIFFREQRILPLARKALSRHLISKEMMHQIEHLLWKPGQLFPDESPALLHGDLWKGNILFSREKQAVLIDPAVYFGHREMDLAMARLFGGFPPVFFEAYDKSYPLQDGWQQRVDLCILYPVLVHILLFGHDYAAMLADILRRLNR